MNLLSINIAGVLHRASEPLVPSYSGIHSINRASITERHFVWSPILTEIVRDTDISIVIHSNWRRHFDDEVIKTFFPEEIAKRILCLGRMIPQRKTLSPDDYLSTIIDRVNPKSVCVLDDQPIFFYAGRVKHWIAHNHGTFVWCAPEVGIRDRHVQDELSNWSQYIPNDEPSLFQSY